MGFAQLVFKSRHCERSEATQSFRLRSINQQHFPEYLRETLVAITHLRNHYPDLLLPHSYQLQHHQHKARHYLAQRLK